MPEITEQVALRFATMILDTTGEPSVVEQRGDHWRVVLLTGIIQFNTRPERRYV